MDVLRVSRMGPNKRMGKPMRAKSCPIWWSLLPLTTRGLLQDRIDDSLHDHVLARPLVHNPVRALHHDVGVEFSLAVLSVCLHLTKPELEVL
jgi:hypothetical protein